MTSSRFGKAWAFMAGPGISTRPHGRSSRTTADSFLHRTMHWRRSPASARTPRGQWRASPSRFRCRRWPAMSPRVIARVFRIREDVTTGIVRRRIAEIAARLVPADRPGAFNQAMMELGATICTPLAPACPKCPLERLCLARAAGEEQDLPVSSRPRSPPVVPVVFGLVTADDRVLVVRRPRGQLLAGLWGLPGGERSGRSEKADLKGSIRSQTGVEVRVGPRWTHVDRTFSHRKWSGSIYRCSPIQRPKETESVRWIPREEAMRLPLVPFHRDAIEALAGIESFESIR